MRIAFHSKPDSQMSHLDEAAMSGVYEWVTSSGAKFGMYGMKEDIGICPYCGRYIRITPEMKNLVRIPDHTPPRDKGLCPASGLELFKKQIDPYS